MKTSPFRLIFFATLLTLRCGQAAVYQESGGQVVIEGEHFDSRTTNASNHAFLIVPTEDPGAGALAPFLNARGDMYIQVLPDNGGPGGANIDPLVRFRVNLGTVGTYRLYLRWGGFDGGSDSVYAGLAGISDGTGGTVADWYRYARTLTANSDFNGGWQGVAGFERTDASGNDVAATWVITSPGVYTIQLSQREDGASVDALSFQLSTLPAPTDPGPAESAISTTYPVAVTARTPGANAVGVFPDTSITVQITDGGSTQLNTNSITLSLNGTALSNPTITKSGNTTTLRAAPPSLLPAGSVNSLRLTFNDNAVTPQSFTNTWSFTVENYATLPASLARPAGTVDTASTGFSVFVHQARLGANLPNDTARAEAQLRGSLIDPANGAPFANHASGGTPQGNFTDDNVINWNQEMGAGGNLTEIGNFQTTSTPSFSDEPIPGIPGDEASTDNIAAELISYLELPAGLIRLGVNSDDGFRVTSAVNPRDASALQLGVFSGGRGAADTLFSVLVQSAGIFPVRLIWYEGNGGANLEFFSVDISTGQKILVNDRATAGHLKAYRTSSFASPPYFNQIRPAPGAANVNAGAKVFVELLDQATQVNSGSVTLSFNGTAVSPVVAKTGGSTTINFDPPGLMPSGSTNDLVLTYSDSASTSYTNTWRFVVQNYATFPVVPPTAKLSTVDTTKPGFLLKMRQMAVGRPGGDNLPAPLTQLNDGFLDPATPGQPYADLIDRSQAGGEPGSMFNPDGSFTEVGIINYNEDSGGLAAEQGVFQAPTFADKAIPGIPGTTASFDNIAMVAFTILDLKSGVHRFAVNSDDGFLFTVDNPFDAFANRLGLFDGGRGAASTFYDFVVNEDGFYPFGLVWWEGGGDANVELFYVDPDTDVNLPVNYRPNASAIKAYRPASLAPSRPFVQSVSPAPGAVSVPKDAAIAITIIDGTAAADTNSIRLLFNGAQVTPAITRSGGTTTITFDPPGDLAFLSTNNATLIFSDTGSPSLSRTNAWSFVVESSLPKAIFIIGNAAAPNASEVAIRTRLQSQFGFEVTYVDDDAAVPANAGRAALILVCSTSGSGNITKYRDVTAPILDWEWAAYDGLALSTGDGATIDNSQTQVEIVNAGHPLAAGLAAGVITVFPAPAAQMASVDPTLLAPSVTVVANAVDGTGRAVLFGVESGAALHPDPVTGSPVTAPARRAGFPLGGDTFTGLNPDGLKLFDAAIRWTASISAQPRFNPPTISAGNVTLSWTGAGTLEQTDSLSPPNWGQASSQANPQTVPATGTRFYRIRQ